MARGYNADEWSPFSGDIVDLRALLTGYVAREAAERDRRVCVVCVRPWMKGVRGMAEGASDNTRGGGPLVLAGYEIFSKVEQGADYAVFKARQMSLDRVVSLKVFGPRLTGNAAFRVRFLHDAGIIGQLKHPNIAQVFDAGVTGNHAHMATELVDGLSLKDVLKTHGAFEEQRALEVTRDIASALDCAHRAGVLHRGVELGNILISSDGAAKLSGFGIAGPQCPPDPDCHDAEEPPEAPVDPGTGEVRWGTDVDGRSDIYSLGAVLHYLLTGRPPRPRRTAADPTPDPREIAPAISAGVAALVQKAMARDRSERHSTAQEFLSELFRLLGQEGAAAAPLPVTRRPHAASAHRVICRSPNTGWTGPQIAAIVTVAVFALGGLVYFIISEPAAEKDGRKLAEVREWVGEHPGEYYEALKRYRQARGEMTDAECRRRVDEEAAALREERARKGNEWFAELAAKADELKAAGRYVDAIKLCEKLPPEFENDLWERVHRTATALREDCESKLKARVKRAQTLLQAGDAYSGLQELDRLSGILLSKYREPIASLHSQLKRALPAQAASAMKRLGLRLDTIEQHVKKRDLRAVVETAQAAARDEQSACIQAPVASVGRIADTIAAVGASPVTSFAPQTPDESIAAAILALSAENVAAMTKALENAGGHPFHTRYAAKLELLAEHLRVRGSERQRRSRARLARFRSGLPAALARHRYSQLVAELDRMIADPDLALIRSEAQADRRVMVKLVAALDHVRANLRSEARKAIKTPTRHSGIPATVRSYDSATDRVTFNSGAPEAVTGMRAIDLAILLRLKPGPSDVYHEQAALLLIGGGSGERAKLHADKVPRRRDIDHFRRVLRSPGS